MTINPLTYGVATLRHALYRGQEVGMDVPPLGLSLGVSIGFAIAVLVLGARTLRSKKWRSR
jgi:ABC-type polysaccharide/polyol phosphate export permease